MSGNDVPGNDVHVDVDHRDRAWRTPLHYAAVDEEVGLVQELLAAGAEVDARDYKEWTPLHMAAQIYDNLEVVKLLVAAGADVNAVNDDGNAALNIATASPGGSGGIIRFLLAHGADPYLENKEGSTPIERVMMSTDKFGQRAAFGHLVDGLPEGGDAWLKRKK